MTGGVSYDISVAGIAGIAEAFARAPEIAAEELVAATWSASLLTERELKEAAPVGATNTFRTSIGAQRPVVLGASVLGEVGTPVAHAVPVELGTKPHHPPVEPLIDWVEAKLGLRDAEAERAAKAIAFAIAKRGTKGAFVFRDTFAAVEPQVGQIYTQAVNRIARRIDAGGA